MVVGSDLFRPLLAMEDSNQLAPAFQFLSAILELGVRHRTLSGYRLVRFVKVVKGVAAPVAHGSSALEKRGKIFPFAETVLIFCDWGFVICLWARTVTYPTQKPCGAYFYRAGGADWHLLRQRY